MTLPNIPNFDKRFAADLIWANDGETLNIIEIDECTIQILESSPLIFDSQLLFGDLFRVKKLASGEYEIIEPILPSAMGHFMCSFPDKYTDVLHELGGEWEQDMGMIFCLHVPRDRVEELLTLTEGFDLTNAEEIFSS